MRRVKRLDPGRGGSEQGGLLDAYRHHAVFTDSPLTMLAAEASHRDHAIIEQVIPSFVRGERPKALALGCLSDFPIVGGQQIHIEGESGGQVDRVRTAQPVRAPCCGEQVCTIDIDQGDAREKRIDHAGLGETLTPRRTVQLGVQEIGGDDVVPARRRGGKRKSSDRGPGRLIS